MNKIEYCLQKLLNEQHLKHKSKGYRYLAQLVRNETGWVFSDNLAHKCCKYANIKSKTGRGYTNKGEEHEQFPNAINGKWKANRPMEIVVSDILPGKTSYTTISSHRPG